MRCLNQCIGPVLVTEKSCALKESLGKVLLFAPLSMTKKQVKLLFLQKFETVKLLAVNSTSVPGKIKRFKGRLGERSARKKFILTIESGSQVDFGSL